MDQVRVRDFTGSVPWRRFRSHHGQGHLSGKYWSATTGAHVLYESRLELARLLLADFDAGVSWIWAQPARLDAVVDGRDRWHVPDFLLTGLDDGATVVNVKPAGRLSDPKVASALTWPGTVLSAHGWRYEVWSGADPVIVENIRFLAAYRRPGLVRQDLIDRANEQVRDGERFAEAEARLAGSAPGWTVRPGLLALLWRQVLLTDLSRPLSGSSILRRPGLPLSGLRVESGSAFPGPSWRPDGGRSRTPSGTPSQARA